MGPGLNSRAKEDERADGQELVLAGAAAEQPRKVEEQVMVLARAALQWGRG